MLTAVIPWNTIYPGKPVACSPRQEIPRPLQKQNIYCRVHTNPQLILIASHICLRSILILNFEVRLGTQCGIFPFRTPIRECTHFSSATLVLFTFRIVFDLTIQTIFGWHYKWCFWGLTPLISTTSLWATFPVDRSLLKQLNVVFIIVVDITIKNLIFFSVIVFVYQKVLFVYFKV